MKLSEQYKGILQQIELRTDLGAGYITGDNAKKAQFIADVNLVLSELWHIINQATGSWTFDDGNYNTLPRSVNDLVAGVDKYLLPEEALTIKRVEIKTGGDWEILRPGLSGNSYQLINGVLIFNEAPSKNGFIRISFDRGIVELENDNDEPGFAKPYHDIIPVKVAIKFLEIKQPNTMTLAVLYKKEEQLINDIKKHYALRFKDKKQRIFRAYNKFR